MTGSQREEGREGLMRNFRERKRGRSELWGGDPHVSMGSERMLR